MSEQPSALAEFGRSTWAKVLGTLTIIMMLLAIYVEVVAAWRGTNDAIITSINVQKARADADKAEADAVQAKIKANAMSLPPVNLDAILK